MVKLNYIGSKNQGKSIKELFCNVKIGDISKDEHFYYYIDINKSVYDKNSKIGNLAIDYEKILNNSLEDYRNKIISNKKDDIFCNDELNVIDGIEILIDKITNKISINDENKIIVENIKNIKNNKTKTFYESLQRILFFNQLIWQTNHTLNGLGRLDKILISYYKKDIQEGIITKQGAKELLREFLLTLHKYYELKSNSFLGDTGQIIELGGKETDGTYYYNELTYIFIDLIKDLKLPDPKLLLRVSNNVPKDLMELSLECIKTGIGCPLFANDDIIIDKLIKFGYKEEDAYNYGTSACWEPYIIGKSVDPNNIGMITFVEPFKTLLENEDLDKITNTEELILTYKKYLEKYLISLIEQLNKVKLQEDPLLSLFIDNCIINNKDIANGGAIYNHYGLTSVGLSNLVNSIILKMKKNY